MFSAIVGFGVSVLHPVNAGVASAFEVNKSTRHIIFTAETHNFPTGEKNFHFAYWR